MRLSVRRFVRVFGLLLVFDTIVFAAVFVPRPPLSAEQWHFLESQRPKPPGEKHEIVTCADCLNFAVFRRGFGGWESLSAKVLQLVNLPAFAASQQAFSLRQWRHSGTSQANSDYATFILVGASFLECAALALALSVRFGSRPSPV